MWHYTIFPYLVFVLSVSSFNADSTSLYIWLEVVMCQKVLLSICLMFHYYGLRFDLLLCRDVNLCEGGCASIIAELSYLDGFP